MPNTKGMAAKDNGKSYVKVEPLLVPRLLSKHLLGYSAKQT